MVSPTASWPYSKKGAPKWAPFFLLTCFVCKPSLGLAAQIRRPVWRNAS